MIWFVAKRLTSGIVTLFVTSTLTFFLLFYSAPNVVQTILGPDATQADVHAKEVALGLDRPLWQRYLNWMGHAVRGDFGTSWLDQHPVTSSILSRLPTTLSIVVVSLVISGALAVALGLAAAVRRGWLDRLLQVFSIVGAAIPQFVLAVVLVTVFGIHLGWFPATGYVSFATSPVGWVATVTLPVVALSIGGISSTAQQLRSATIELLERDYVRTLRSRGLPTREILLRHVLRGAAPPSLTVLSLHFIAILGGVVVIEQIFALPGIGYLALKSTTAGDMPVLMGVIVYVVIVVVVVNLLVDLAVGWLNPKARIS